MALVHIGSWKSLVAYIACFTVVITCMALSYWQLSRAYEKQQKLALFIDNKITNESLYDSLNKDINTLNGREVSISGYFNTQYIWYLDNQILDGRVGVDILTLFKPQQLSKYFLVNLGFIPISHRGLPDVSLPSNEVRLNLLIKSDGLKGFTLSSVAMDPNSQRLQFIDTSELMSLSKKAIFPAVFYQQDINDQALIAKPHYNPVVMSPQKHHAYALQWFLIALAAAFIFYKVKKVES